MLLNRRALVGSLTSACLIGSGHRARAESVTYKCATDLPASHPAMARLKQAVDRIKAETMGEVDIALFPNSQLGSDTDTLGQVRSGATEFFLLPGLVLSSLVPTAAMNCLGFLFPDYDAVWKTMDGPFGAYIRSQIEKAGLVPMTNVWDNGFRQITSSNRAINSPADLDGFKIRVPVSPIWTSLFKALGASPMSLNFNEVYSALQTRIADGQENPLAVIDTAKLYEVQKYCAVTNHIWDGFWFVGNGRVWNGISAPARDIIAKHINAAALEERGDLKVLNQSVSALLSSKGLQLTTPPTDPFRDQLKKSGFYQQWAAKYGPEAWALLEGSVGKLT